MTSDELRKLAENSMVHGPQARRAFYAAADELDLLSKRVAEARDLIEILVVYCQHNPDIDRAMDFLKRTEGR